MLAIFALTIGSFAIGVTEFVIMGLLQMMSSDLNVSIDIAGWLITGYAFGVAFGGPVIMIMLLKMNQKKALLILMGIFVLGSIASAVSSNYTLLMLARIISSLAHGCFFGIGAVLATSLVPKEKQASAIALMFMGLNVANIIGVPIGTFIGQAFGWRATFWFVTFLGVVSFVAVKFLVPNKKNEGGHDLKAEFKGVLEFPVLMGFLATIFSFCAVFTTLSYIAPILTETTMFPAYFIGWILLIFGVGVTLGNSLGGKLWDKNGIASLFWITFAVAITYLLLSFVSPYKIPIVLTIFIWGVVSFAACPGLQMNVVNSAKSAPNLASTFNISAFNIGNGLGAIFGGLVIRNGLSFNFIPLVSCISALIALFFVWLGRKK